MNVLIEDKRQNFNFGLQTRDLESENGKHGKDCMYSLFRLLVDTERLLLLADLPPD